jgi:hypothetical protein
MTVQTTARNAELSDLVELLKNQHAAKADVVAPAANLSSRGGMLVVKGAEAQLDEDGVTDVDGVYRPTGVFDEGVAEKLGIPLAYVRRMRSERPDLYDANVNGWLHGATAQTIVDVGVDSDTVSQTPAAPGDPRRFLVRAFRGADGEVGVARALLSDSYKVIDNLDVLMASLAGVREAGAKVEIDGCDLTDRRMYVRVVAPEVQALAPVLLKDYRSPFRDPAVDAQRAHGNGGWTLERGREAAAREGLGFAPGGEPIVFAGFVITNSETGGGAFSVVPRMVVQVCKNGLTITADALRAVHLGGKLDEGVVRWSDDTQRKSLALVTAKTRDAVATFLDTDYMAKVITRIEEQSEVRVTDAPATVKQLAKKLAFDEGTQAGILDHFMRGGDATAGGILSAVTSYAQVIPDADKAHEVESKGLEALAFAAVLA